MPFSRPIRAAIVVAPLLRAISSLVHTFRFRPLGASFELVDADETFRHILATDVEMGPAACG